MGMTLADRRRMHYYEMVSRGMTEPEIKASMPEEEWVKMKEALEMGFFRAHFGTSFLGMVAWALFLMLVILLLLSWGKI